MASSIKIGNLLQTAFKTKSHKIATKKHLEVQTFFENDSVIEELDRSTEQWSNCEVALAAKVLSASDPKKHGVLFSNDNQMIRVYDIIFDVFRYGTILDEILKNIDFDKNYLIYTQMQLLVWLITFDYYRNKFKTRKLSEKEKMNYKELKLLGIIDVLQEIKIQLAASLSKYRIKHCALSLADVLPKHLRNERFNKSSETIITCWINSFLTSEENALKILDEVGLRPVNKLEDLTPNTYKKDSLLPYFLQVYPADRSEFFKKTKLFNKYLLIIQERRYCIGPAMLDRTMSANKLCGNVAQTHFTIQNAVAYLASLLFKRSQSLIVYGAAERKKDYYSYFVKLGVQNCKLVTEDFLLSNSDHLLLDIVSILATPPNTNTGVTDPVQLVCSKGGDLTLLKAVTSLDYTEDSSDIPCMLEQRDTLRMTMSKPQVQIIVYETHSRLELENGGMVKSVVEEMNGWAYEKHNSDNFTMTKPEEMFNTSIETPWRSAVFQPIQIPDMDRFETMMLYPDKKLENMEESQVTGSIYLAAIKRVELMTFDANHLICMAEKRGLFGKPIKGRKQKVVSPVLLSLSNSDKPRKTINVEQMHILVPTHSFKQRCLDKVLVCPRFIRAYDKTSIITRWWRCCIQHIIKSLRKPFFVLNRIQMVRLKKKNCKKELCMHKVIPIFKLPKTSNLSKFNVH